jgi:hypothetical protein
MHTLDKCARTLAWLHLWSTAYKNPILFWLGMNLAQTTKYNQNFTFFKSQLFMTKICKWKLISKVSNNKKTTTKHYKWLKACLSLKNNLLDLYLYTRCLMGSTDQADPSCFYFRISWILMERPWFYSIFVASTCCRASEVGT